jgi:zinc transport system substrate-binding protein
MKKLVLSVLLVAAMAAGIDWAVSRKDSAEDTGKLQVPATYYPLYDFARKVGGQYVQVSNLTPAGSEPHDYDPSPRALAQAQDAKVVVYNGAHMEPWIDGFLGEYDGVAVKASKGIVLRTQADEDHADERVQDPHFWLDPVAAQKIVANIRDGLRQADPAHADYYTSRAANYSARLRQLDADFQSGLASCTTRTVVTSHEAFSYLAVRYNLEVEAIAGISTEQEPTAARLAALADLVRERGIQYVFFESLVSPRLADTIAAETGAQTLVFDPIEGITDEQAKAGADYLSLQRQNLANLRRALACR